VDRQRFARHEHSGEELPRENDSGSYVNVGRAGNKPASADKLDSSADYFLPRCRAVVNHDFNKLFDVGVCLGAGGIA
jgi:hypothetical protein